MTPRGPRPRDAVGGSGGLRGVGPHDPVGVVAQADVVRGVSTPAVDRS